MLYVIVAEPHKDSREMYVESLASEGIAATGAETTADACEIASELCPDALIAAVKDPRELLETMRRLHSARATRSVAIVALASDPSRMVELRNAGCDAVLLKPCLPASVADEVRRAVGERARRRSMSSISSAVP